MFLRLADADRHFFISADGIAEPCRDILARGFPLFLDERRESVCVDRLHDQAAVSVFLQSLNHIYAQVIDDSIGNTIAAASTVEASVKALIEGKNKKEAAFIVGETVAKRALEKGVAKVVFDRGGYLYTGRVAELAAGARKAGLDF